jgi:hypothetical protein
MKRGRSSPPAEHHRRKQTNQDQDHEHKLPGEAPLPPALLSIAISSRSLVRLHRRSTFPPVPQPTSSISSGWELPHHQSGAATIASRKKSTPARLTRAEMAAMSASRPENNASLHSPFHCPTTLP